MTKKSETTPKKDLTKEVMKEIKSGQAKMKPRVYFALGSIFMGLGVASSLFTFFIITTITFFRIRMFGLTGLIWSGKPLFAPMPIFILIMSLLILWGGFKLIKNYEFAYKHNFIALAIIIISLIVTMGFLFDQFGANQVLQKHPPLKPFYQQHQPGFSPVTGKKRPMPAPQRRF